MSRTLYLRTAYDGTDFHGWQRQAGVRTVQEVLERKVERVVRHPVALLGSGRTDAGVHAAGHVSNFVTTSPLDLVRIRRAIESRLPDDLGIVHLREVHPEFHATTSATSKLYRYRVHVGLKRPVRNRTQRYTYAYRFPLDVSRMREGAAHFVGEMDFSAMAGKSAPRLTMVRTVLRCEIERHLDEIRIDVEGTGFLYNQVRTMVGTLLNIGSGRWEPDRLAEILKSRDRANAGPTAPALGLCLQWVKYPPWLLTPPAADDPPTEDNTQTKVAGNSDDVTP